MPLHETRHIKKGDPFLGSDPEIFLKDGDQIVGSEKVIPPQGLGVNAVVRDGVQAELHPIPYVCRANLANSLSICFRTLLDHLKMVPTMSVCLTPVVTLSEAEFAQLSPESRVLGCQPSLNLYDPQATVNVPPGYPVRSAGGHIHIGLNGGDPRYSIYTKWGKGDHAKQLVQLMDILVGNTCVLIDRDPRAAERREFYGRAGEYRLPSHGVEYRTLSNFWLQGHELLSLIGGLTKLAVGILASTDQGVYQKTGKKDAWGYDTYHYSKEWNAYTDLLSRVSPAQVRKAINENDLRLAKQNWEGVRSFIEEYVPKQDTGLDTTRLEAFEFFLKRIHETAEQKGTTGLEVWFPQDVNQWINLGDQHGRGWETFLDTTVTQTMKKEQTRG